MVNGLKLAMLESELLTDYDRANMKNNLNYFREGLSDVTATVLTSRGEAHTSLLADSIEQLKDIGIETEEITAFFSSVANSPKLNEIPITTKIFNTSVIEKIRPQYLGQMGTEISMVIDKFLKGTISKREIETTYMSPAYLPTIKKQLVKMQIPYDLPVKDMYRFDASTIININQQSISTTVLPFLRGTIPTIREMEALSANTISVITDSYASVSACISVLDGMLKDEKISLKEYRFLSAFLYKTTRDFMAATSFLTFAVLKKMGSIYHNIVAYKDLQGKILSYFPEGEAILHESVFDNSVEFEDLDNDNVVNEILMGNASTIVGMMDYAFRKIKSDMDYSMGSSTWGDISGEGNDRPYLSASHIIHEIESGIDTLDKNIRDPLMAFDDAVEKSGFADPLNQRFASIMNSIRTADEYTNADQTMDADSKQDIIEVGLSELQNGQNLIASLATDIRVVFETIRGLKTKLETADPEEYRSSANVDQAIEFLTQFEGSYRQFIHEMTLAFVSRIKNITDILNDIVSENYDNPDIIGLSTEGCDDNEFEDILTESLFAMNDESIAYEFGEYLKEYHSARTYYESGEVVVYEDGLAATPNATSNNSNNTNNKASVTGAAPVKKTIGDRIKGIISGIKKFFTDTASAMKSIITKQSSNLNLLESNRDKILNSDFSKVTITIIPYHKYFSMDALKGDMEKLKNSVSGITKDKMASYKDQKQLNADLFSFMERNMGNTSKISEPLTTYYKTKGANMKAESYSGDAAKKVMQSALDYCIAYYKTNNKMITDETGAIMNACENKCSEFENLNESVLLEADENQNTTTDQNGTNNNTQNANSQPNTDNKPSVQVDPKVRKNEAKVSGVNSNNNGVVDILKWMSGACQTYCSAICTSTKDINFEYLKIIKPFMPKTGKGDVNAQDSNQNAENTDQNNGNQ